jgi:hypothetical protein
VIGALKPPGAQDAAAEQAMQQDAEQVFAMLNALRDRQRQAMLQQAAAAGGGFTYEQGPIDGPAPPLQQFQQAQAQVHAQGQAQTATGVPVENGGSSQGPAQQPAGPPPPLSVQQL